MKAEEEGIIRSGNLKSGHLPFGVRR